jgi:hypothetical protein
MMKPWTHTVIEKEIARLRGPSLVVMLARREPVDGRKSSISVFRLVGL